MISVKKVRKNEEPAVVAEVDSDGSAEKDGAKSLHQHVIEPKSPPPKSSGRKPAVLKVATPPQSNSAKAILVTGLQEDGRIDGSEKWVDNADDHSEDDNEDGDDSDDTGDDDDEKEDNDEDGDDSDDDGDDDDENDDDDDDNDNGGEAHTKEMGKQKNKMQQQQKISLAQKPRKQKVSKPKQGKPSAATKKTGPKARNDKFLPNKVATTNIFVRIAEDSPWQHKKGGQGSCWREHIEYCKNTLNLNCMKETFSKLRPTHASSNFFSTFLI
jgi:hypothetical protein